LPITVLNVGFPLAPVSESTAGGAEQILSILDEYLVRGGHRSLVVAPAGSKVRGQLLPIAAVPSQLDDGAHGQAIRQTRQAIQWALDQFSIDIVHMHGIDFCEYLPDPGVPVVVTLHLPPRWYSPRAFAQARSDTYLVCVSQSEARACAVGSTFVIENGIRLGPYRPARKRDYVLGLGRICPEKGFHLALDAAGRSRVPLLLAGEVFGYEAHQKYFREVLRPRLGGQHRFLGPIGPARKRRLLTSARCLLVPSLVDETSSLVAMEALAAGTPVVAFRRGALSEIVEHGRTGFLVRNVEEMSAAIEQARNIDSDVCRREAERRFSAESMFGKYLDLYQRLSAPQTVHKRSLAA
jgi:glycosyltransferase involved in cell wall biosynthesis